MKTRTKATTKESASSRKTGQSRGPHAPKRNFEDRDLNEDDQEQIINIDKDDDLALPIQSDNRSAEFDVEAEEEREKRRKAEYLHPEEPMN